MRDSPSGSCEIDVDGVRLAGDLSVPSNVGGSVIFAHGSGSSRHSPRNQAVARSLNRAGLVTLLFDLLTPAEEADRANVFDIDLLAERLVAATSWLGRQPGSVGTRIGYFGASTGAAAALVAGSKLGDTIGAVVSRGGRPDLAGGHLSRVRAPTLLIVGGNDPAVLELNRAAQRKLVCPTRLDVVPGATHLFEEPGTLEVVAARSVDWFSTYLTRPHA